MLTVSLHGIRIIAPIGLYAQEKTHPNTFEVDVDVQVRIVDGQQWPFVDYTIINDIVVNAFAQDVELLESLVYIIHSEVKQKLTDALSVKVAVRKMTPPLQNDVKYSQVCYEA